MRWHTSLISASKINVVGLLLAAILWVLIVLLWLLSQRLGIEVVYAAEGNRESRNTAVTALQLRPGQVVLYTKYYITRSEYPFEPGTRLSYPNFSKNSFGWNRLPNWRKYTSTSPLGSWSYDTRTLSWAGVAWSDSKKLDPNSSSAKSWEWHLGIPLWLMAVLTSTAAIWRGCVIRRNWKSRRACAFEIQSGSGNRNRKGDITAL